MYGKRLKLRVYPHHNDVKVRRVWEAGTCLVEYLIQHPAAVRGRSEMEVGSGVGLTGLLVAGLCRPIRVRLTYFTDICLTNLVHNVEVVNRHWLEGQGVVTGKWGTLKTLRSPRGLSWCPPFGSMMPRVLPSLPPRALSQKISPVPPS